MTRLRARSCIMLAALALASATACKYERRFLEPDEMTGELPDLELDLEAARADPGHELYMPPEGTPLPKTRPCTQEEIAAHVAENTNDDGTINEIGIFCLEGQPPPKPALPAAQQPEQAVTDAPRAQ